MHVLVVIGTRPEAIKLAPVIQELKRRSGGFRVSVCLTAQHRDILDQALSAFDIEVQHDLDLMQHDQNPSEVVRAVLAGMDELLTAHLPDLMLVQGDTTTAFAVSLAAYHLRIPVGHVEAGLRTYDKYRPFPEEMNRRLCDVLCDYHYAPTERAKANLLEEHIPAEHIRVTGNTVIDALLDVAARPYTFSDPLLEAAGTVRRLILVTAHRRESFGEPFRHMCQAVRDLVRNNPDVEVIYPVHPNPNVRATTAEILAGQDRLHLIDPLDYVSFVHLLKKATLALTDSGGIQEEAPSLGKPVLVMREVTERPEAIEAGTALLVGTSYKAITRGVQHLLDDKEAYTRMAAAVNPYGDGKAARRIVDHIAAFE